MSWTNLCSCALMKDHKMRQIINDPTILNNYEFGKKNLRQTILLNFFLEFEIVELELYFNFFGLYQFDH